MTESPRILFYSPYSRWNYHAVIEATLGHALSLRGAQVAFTTCDGLFPACDVFREGIHPRGPFSCLDCQADTARTFADMRAPYAWSGHWLSPDSRRKVGEWSEALADDTLLDACWDGYPVGTWAQSSAFYQFRMSRFDLDDAAVRQGLREHIAGTALSVEFLRPLFDEYRPHALVLLNGRFFSHWSAFELARERGIRVVTHERGLLKNTLRFSLDARIHDLAIYDELWSRWKEIPLAEDELLHVQEILDNRRAGKNFPWQAYSPPPQDEAAVRRRLGLGQRPVITLFSSSDDESAAFPERRRGAYPDPLEWLAESVRLADRFPDHRLVVRLHPNLTANGVNRQTLEQARVLEREAAENVRFVWPDDDVSSYTLADMASVGLVYFTTLGLEMACRGQRVVTPARGLYGPFPFVRWAETSGDYVEAIHESLDAPSPDGEIARQALRYAFHYYRELCVPFAPVEEEPRHKGKPVFTDVLELMPGLDPDLDRVCDLILTGREMLTRPRDGHRQRDTTAEDAFLARLGRVSAADL